MGTDYPPKRRTGSNTRPTNGNGTGKRRISKKKQRMRRIRMIRRVSVVLLVCLLIGLAVYIWHRNRPDEPSIPPVETEDVNKSLADQFK